VVVLASGAGDWRLVEHLGPWLRVRGWTRLGDSDESWHTSGSGSGRGYGISDTARVDVPAGTCLFAAPDGPVIGVQLAPLVRYAHGPDRGWWELYVGNAWGLFTVSAHQLGTDAAGKPVFARCP